MKNTSELIRDIKIGFHVETITLKLEDIHPLKILSTYVCESNKFTQVVASIKEIGIIEPPVVTVDKNSEKYILLDGHLRIQALRALGHREVACIVSTDDETFTYNKYVNRVSPIQEHKMILEVIKRGVPEEKIARALNVNVRSIIVKRNLLNGICEEAIELLKDKMVGRKVFGFLKRMKPERQVEAAILMNDSNVYTVCYIRAILASTPKSQTVMLTGKRRTPNLNEEQVARMEAEMLSLQGEYRLIEESYGINVLNLAVSKGYIGALLGNAKITNYLSVYHREIFAEFKKIAEMTALENAEFQN